MTSSYPPLIKGVPYNRSLFSYQDETIDFKTFRSQAQLNIPGKDQVVAVREINTAGVTINNEDLLLNANLIGGANTTIKAMNLLIPNINTVSENLVVQAAPGKHILIGFNDGDGDVYVNTNTASKTYFDGGDVVVNNGQKLRVGTGELYFDENNRWSGNSLKVATVELGGVDLDDRLVDMRTIIDDNHDAAVASFAATNSTISALSQSVDSSFNEVRAAATVLTSTVASNKAAIESSVLALRTATDASFAQVDATATSNKVALEASIASTNTSIQTTKAQLEAAAEATQTTLQSNIDGVASDLDTFKVAVDASFNSTTASLQASIDGAKTQLEGVIAANQASANASIANTTAALQSSIGSLQAAVDTSFNVVESSLLALASTAQGNKAAADASFNMVAQNLSDIEVSLNTLQNTKADVSFVEQKVSQLVGSAPELLDTLGELAASIAQDNNFSSTMLSIIGTKADTSALTSSVTSLEQNIATRAPTTYVDSGLSTKLSIADFDVAVGTINTTLAQKADAASLSSAVSTINSSVALKADISALDAAATSLSQDIAQKADAAALSSAVDTLDASIAAKSDKTYVDTQLATKQSISTATSQYNELNTAINAKLSSSYAMLQFSNIDAALLTKASASDLSGNIASLTSYVDGQLATKASAQLVTDLSNNLTLQLGTIDGALNTKASVTYVDDTVSSAISDLVSTAPGTLNTLGEIADALNQDAAFSVTITNLIAQRATKTYVDGEVASLQGQIDLKASAASLAQKVDQTEYDLSYNDLVTVLSSKADSSLVSTKADTSYVQGLVSDLSANIATELGGKVGVGAFDASFAQLSTDVSSLDTRMDTFMNGASAAYDTLLEIQTALTDTSFNTYIVGEIGTLQSQVNSKATSADIAAAIAAIPPTDLSGYATTSALSAATGNIELIIQELETDLSGNYATKTYVDSAVAAVSGGGGGSVDLTPYALIADVDASFAAVSTLVAGKAAFADVSAAMVSVKDEILGGVGPAFDTLIELSNELQTQSSAASALAVQVSSKANDGDVVHLAGAETVTGTKTFDTINVSNINSVTATELGYLSGVTSGLQAQLTTLSQSSGGVNLTSNQTIGGDKLFTGLLSTFKASEAFVTATVSGTTATCDFSQGGVFRITPLSSTLMTANFTNVPLVAGRTITMVLIMDNSTTFKTRVSTCTVNGSSVGTTIRWSGGSTAVPAVTSSNIAIQTISFLCLNDGAITTTFSSVNPFW